MTIDFNETAGSPMGAPNTETQMTKSEFERIHGILPDDIKRYMPGTSHPYRLNQKISFHGFGDEIERRTGLKCFCADLDMTVYLCKPGTETLAGIVLIDAVYVEDLKTGWRCPDKKPGITVLKKHAHALTIPNLVILGEHNIGTEEERLPGRELRPVRWWEMQAHHVWETKDSIWNHNYPARSLIDVVEDFANEVKGKIIY